MTDMQPGTARPDALVLGAFVDAVRSARSKHGLAMDAEIAAELPGALRRAGLNIVSLAASLPAPAPGGLREALDGAYRERNAVAAALIRTNGWHCWVYSAPDAEGWYIVYADTPKGQVSWHVSPDDLHLFADADGAPLFSGVGYPWDGHTTEEKYARLASLPTPAPDGLDALREAAEAVEAEVVRGKKSGDWIVPVGCQEAFNAAIDALRAALAAAPGPEGEG